MAAFAEHRIETAFAEVRRRIGMGGDKLMPEVSGIRDDSSQGSAIATRRGQIFRERFLPTLRAFPDAGALVAAVKERGLTVVAASSAKREELEPLLRIAGTALLGLLATALAVREVLLPSTSVHPAREPSLEGTP